MGRPPWRALEDLERSREARDAAEAPCPVPARPERIELAAGQEQAEATMEGARQAEKIPTGGKLRVPPEVASYLGGAAEAAIGVVLHLPAAPG